MIPHVQDRPTRNIMYLFLVRTRYDLNPNLTLTKHEGRNRHFLWSLLLNSDPPHAGFENSTSIFSHYLCAEIDSMQHFFFCHIFIVILCVVIVT